MHFSRHGNNRRHRKHLVLALLWGSMLLAGETTIYYYYDPLNDSYTFTNMCSDLRICKPLFTEKGTVIHRKGYRVEEKRYDNLIQRSSDEFGIDFYLIKSVIKAESLFDPEARSTKGAIGLMQLMPDTAKMLGVKNPYDPAQNIRGGTRYLYDMIRKFGTVDKALAAYNAGPAAVVYYEGVPPFKETQEYIAKVRRFYHEYTGRSL